MNNATDILLLNTSVLDLRSADFGFTTSLVGAGGLAKCAAADMPPYTQEQLAAYSRNGRASAGGGGNTAPLLAHAGLRTAIGSNLGRGEYGGLDAQGRAFYDILVKNGVDMSATVIHPSLPTGTTFIHDAPDGERGGMVYFPNANDDFDFERFKREVLRLSPGVVYYMYSGLSDRGDANGGRDLAAFVRWCRAQGPVTIADSHTLCGNPHERIAKGEPVAAYALLAPLLGELDIFFTSVDEARMIRNTLEGAGSDCGADVQATIRGFFNLVAERFTGKTGRPQLFGVTVRNGAHALSVDAQGRTKEVRFVESRFMTGRVVDLVGAGDSFRAGLVGYVARHRDAFLDGTLKLEEAVQCGNLMASLYIMSELNDRYANIPKMERLEAVVRSGKSYADEAALSKAVKRPSILRRVFVGFGFGPIQAGLFVKEAAASGRFDAIVVAEIDAALVESVRSNNGAYCINVAHAECREVETVQGVTLLNPAVPEDAARLREALAQATEIVTSLPSVNFYARGGTESVAGLIAEGLKARREGATVVYTAENDNHAAELLERAVAVASCGAPLRPCQYLNTVIGKMSQSVTGSEELVRLGLRPLAPGNPRAFLVESFNRILVSRITLPGFEPGITVFEEKDDLLPFEEAKLYGHNMAHTLLGFLCVSAGFPLLSDIRKRPDLLAVVQQAFSGEAGPALVARHAATGDPLFTAAGMQAYAEELLERMTRPALADTAARAIRDLPRKLEHDDRLFGAVRLCLSQGIQPVALLTGALAGYHIWTRQGDCPEPLRSIFSNVETQRRGEPTERSSRHPVKTTKQEKAMKNITNTVAALAVAAVLGITGIAQGTDYTWNNGAANMTWDTASANWGGTTLWADAATNSAVFDSTGAGAVTVSGARTFSNLTVNAAGYVFSGDALTLGGTNGVLAINSDTVISNVIQGEHALKKTGAGTLTLSGANTYNGGTTVGSGTLKIGLSLSSTTKPNITVNVSGSTAAMIVDNAVVTNINSLQLTAKRMAGSASMVVTNGARVYATSVVLGFEGSATNKFVLTGSGSLLDCTAVAAANCIVGNSGINAYMLVSGGATATVNRLLVGSVSGVYPSVSNHLEIANGGRFIAAGSTYQPTIGYSSGARDSRLTVGGTNPVSGEPALFNIGGSSKILFIGVSGATNSQCWINTGGVVTNGAIRLDDPSSTLNLDGGVLSVISIVGVGTNYIYNGGAVFNNGASATVVSNSLVNADGQIGGLLKLGSGTLTLARTNTYSGATVVSNGTLKVTNDKALSQTTDVSLSPTGKLDVPAGVTNTVRSLTINGIVKTRGVYTQANLGTETFPGGGTLVTLVPPPKGTMIRVF
jgi:autotransporter-associated beta strand protein